MSVWISWTDTSPPQNPKHIFFLSPVELFIPLDCSLCELPGFEDVCLLSNIMELDLALACSEKLNSSDLHRFPEIIEIICRPCCEQSHV